MFTSIRSLASVLASSLSTSVDSSLWPYTYKTSFIGIRWWQTSFWLVTNVLKQLSVFLKNSESLYWFHTLLSSTSNASKSPLVSPLRSDSSELSYSSKNRMKFTKSRNLSESEAVLLFFPVRPKLSALRGNGERIKDSLLNEAYWNEHFDRSLLRNQNSVWTVKKKILLLL